MRILQITAIDQIESTQAPDPAPAAGEAVVEIRAAALNHRDVWIKQGKYAGLNYPCIPGSDGAGVVIAIGAEVEADYRWREVIINPAFGWGPNPHVQGPSFSILGMPRAGTLAERIAVPVTQLSTKPEHLKWTEAAALPLAGVTAWRALFTRASLNPDDRVLVTGIGAGTALFALQFAVAAGAQVWVTSSSEQKIARAVGLGAQGGFLYTRPGWGKAAARSSGPFQVIVDSAGGPGFEELIDAAAPGGRIVFFGATAGNAPGLDMRKVFWRQLTLMGSSMGNPSDWAGMTGFVGRHRIKPVLAGIYPFARATEAFDLMEKGGQFGKIVVEIAAGA